VRTRIVAAILRHASGRQSVIIRDLDRPSSDRTIAEGAEYDGLRWSPDGKRIAWCGPERSSGPSSNGIWIYDLDRQQSNRVLEDGYGPVWSASGSAIYFSRIRDYAGLWKLDLRTRKVAQVRKWRSWSRHEFDVVGSRLAMAYESGRGQVYSMPLAD
jgi:Tol biopolymer transport system component